MVADCTGYDEYIEHEKNALVVKIGDVKAAQKAVRLLMDNQAVRKKLMKSGIATAKKWTWERSVDFLEKALRKEPVEIFYNENQPRVYDYNQVMLECQNKILLRAAKEQRKQVLLIEQKTKEIEQQKQVIARQQDELKFIQGSKFWRAREKYEKLKRGIKSFK